MRHGENFENPRKRIWRFGGFADWSLPFASALILIFSSFLSIAVEDQVVGSGSLPER